MLFQFTMPFDRFISSSRLSSIYHVNIYRLTSIYRIKFCPNFLVILNDCFFNFLMLAPYNGLITSQPLILLCKHMLLIPKCSHRDTTSKLESIQPLGLLLFWLAYESRQYFSSHNNQESKILLI